MDETVSVALPDEGGAGSGMGDGHNNGRKIALAMLLTAVAVVLLLALFDRLGHCRWPPLCGPLTAEDVSQGRLDTALPAPLPGMRIEQDFVPARDGLTEIELLLVRYGEAAPVGVEHGRFVVELTDGAGALVAVEELSTRDLTHNQTYSLRFEPQAHSAGQRYTLTLMGNELNTISAWGYSLNVYDAGELRIFDEIEGGLRRETSAAEMRFVTRYALMSGEALRAAASPLREWTVLFAALLLLPLPGVLFLVIVRPRGWDVGVWLGAALSLGVATWPIIWEWFSLAGGRWSGPLLWAVVVGGWAAVAGIAWRRRTERSPQPKAAVSGRSSAVVIHSLLVVLVLATLASRFIAVRDQAFPPWVDSSRHALITAVMLDSGRVPTDYEPYLPVDRFPYHYGFHTLSTGVALMTGHALPELLLFLMQLLGGLLPLVVYAAGWMVSRQRVVGLVAAFLVALPFFFPGYYATWGRMTQLAAMVVMPVLLALTWRLGRGWPRFWPVVGVLAAGVFLIHFRVFLFFVPFAAVATLAHLFGHRRIRAMIKSGLLAILLVLPRMIELIRVTEPLETIQRSLPGYNDFPVGYITTGWERAYLIAAAVLAVLLLIGVILRRRWVAFPLVLLLWVGVLFALLAGERLGLPESLVVNLNSMYITLFLPLSLFLAVLTFRLWCETGRWIGRNARADVQKVIVMAAAISAGVLIAVQTVFGWRQQVNILNPQTILAVPQDVAALAWVDEHLPADARVAVSAWQWLGATWAGSDGGAWIVPLTGRNSTTPPVDHIYNDELFADVRAFNEAATAITDWSDAAAAAWLAEQGVTHVFVGRRGGYFDPAALSRNPSLDMLYGHDGAFVFAVRQDVPHQISE